MRKSLLRSLQGLALVSAALVLMGAKGSGCGGGGDSGEGGVSTGDPPIDCGPGYHVEPVCDGMGNCDTAGCHDACVPDDCPDGTEPVLECVVPLAKPDYACQDPSMCPPPDQDCKYVCEPSTPCGMGWHEEKICDGGGMGTVTGGWSGSGWSGYTGGTVIGTYTGGTWGGGTVTWDDSGTFYGNSVPPDPGDGCYIECVPDSCPPGTIEETICGGSTTGAGMGGNVPYPDKGGMGSDDGCYTQCVPVGPCPPGQHQEENCKPDMNGNQECELTCVDDGMTSGVSTGAGMGGWQPF